MVPYETTMMAQWEACGYVPQDAELWAMLCGWLACQPQREGYIAFAPAVVYPLSLNLPKMVTVRRYFEQRQAMPVEIIGGYRIRLVPQWHYRIQRMRRLIDEATQFYHYMGWFPWDEEGNDGTNEL